MQTKAKRNAYVHSVLSAVLDRPGPKNKISVDVRFLICVPSLIPVREANRSFRSLDRLVEQSVIH